MMIRKLVFLTLLLAFSSCKSSGSNGDASVRTVSAFPQISFVRPVDLQFPDDDSNRLFVLEQAGKIYWFENNEQVSEKHLFLDIQNRVNDSGNEEGLLGLAFHPEFSSNGYFYLDYTASNPKRTVIARYQVKSNDPNSADPSSEEVILEIEQPYSNHNGGQIVFGPDGYLYIGMGDGGSAGDPQNNGQSLKTLLGALLRIDVNQSSGDKAYGIPADNPFANNSQGYHEEIYAYGLRNPWRFSFDLQTGRLWAGDVGQNRIEEVDIIEKGKNYGWNIMEGSEVYRAAQGRDTTDLILPVWEYTHQVGQSITGGYAYRGSSVPELQGAYICVDYVSGRIWSVRYDGGSKVQNRELLDSKLNISSFGIDQNNELYLCAFDGQIYKLAPAK